MEDLPKVKRTGRIELTEDSLPPLPPPAPMAQMAPAVAYAAPAPPAPPAFPPVAAKPPAPYSPAGAGFCASCGSPLSAGHRACVSCGATNTAPEAALVAAGSAMAVAAMNHKSPGTAIILSLLWTGAGQLYCGRVGRGIAFFCAAAFSALLMLLLIGFILLPIVWIWAAVDANNLAQEHNRRLMTAATGVVTH